MKVSKKSLPLVITYDTGKETKIYKLVHNKDGTKLQLIK